MPRETKGERVAFLLTIHRPAARVIVHEEETEDEERHEKDEAIRHPPPRRRMNKKGAENNTSVCSRSGSDRCRTPLWGPSMP